MGQEIDRMVDRGCGCLLGTAMTALVQGIGALIGIASVAAAPKPVDVPLRLRAIKPQIPSMAQMVLRPCGRCQTRNAV